MTKQTRIQRNLDNLRDLAQAKNIYHDDGTEFNIYDLKELMAKELVAIEKVQEEEEQENTELSETVLTEKIAGIKELGNRIAGANDILDMFNKKNQATSKDVFNLVVRELDDVAVLLMNIDSVNLDEFN